MRSLYQTTLVALGLAAATFLIAGMAQAQGIGFSSTDFSGTLTLPFEVQWGGMTLPAGDYTLRYRMGSDGTHLVHVRGTKKDSPSGYVLASRQDPNSAQKNELVCLSTGKTYVVRALELPAIQTTLNFSLPQGVELLAREQDREGYPQLAGGPMLIQRVPVVPTKK